MGVPLKSSPPQKSYARHFQVGDTLIDLVMYPSECVQLAQLWSFVLEPMKVVVCLQDWVFKIGSNIIEGVLTLVASYGIMVQLYASSLQHKAMLKIMCSKIHVKILKELCWSHYLDKSEGDWSKPGRHVPESWNNQERKLSSFSIDGDTVPATENAGLVWQAPTCTLPECYDPVPPGQILMMIDLWCW